MSFEIESKNSEWPSYRCAHVRPPCRFQGKRWLPLFEEVFKIFNHATNRCTTNDLFNVKFCCHAATLSQMSLLLEQNCSCGKLLSGFLVVLSLNKAGIRNT